MAGPGSSPAGDRAACFLCGGHSGKLCWREHGCELLACRCGLLYLSRPPAVPVDPSVDHHADGFYASPAALKVKWLSRFRAGGRLLEVGCGEGHFLAAAQRRGYEVAGTEVDAGRAGRVAARLGIPVEAALIEDSAWPERSFDIVFHCDLLSHFPDPLLALGRMTRLLRDDGLLFFEVGLIEESAVRWYRLVDGLGLPQHRWFYSEAALTRLLARAGLEIRRISRFSVAPSLLLSALYHGTAGQRGQAGGAGDGSSGMPAGAGEAGRMRRLRAACHSFARYRIGAVAPKLGPLTAFVIAQPARGRAVA